MRISLESDRQRTEADVLAVDPKSQAAKDFNGKPVMVCALGKKRGKILWVRPETNTNNGKVTPATYSALQQKGAPPTDQFELHELTCLQRLLRYGRLDILLAVLALIVAVAAAAATLKWWRDHAATDTVAIVGPLLIAVLGVVSATRQVGSPPW